MFILDDLSHTRTTNSLAPPTFYVTKILAIKRGFSVPIYVDVAE